MPLSAALLAIVVLSASSTSLIEPQVIETRTVALTQTVTLHDIPEDAGIVRMWVPLPSDTMWQRVVDRKVVSAPGSAPRWRLVRQAQGRGEFVYVELSNPKTTTASVVISCTVERSGVHVAPESLKSTSEVQHALFEETLDQHAPLMAVDERIQELADNACGTGGDSAQQAVLLLQAVAELADHYSKDPTKPTCGRGAAEDCLEHGGGCCTDLHSLFIAMARARGIPARMQYGYRLLDAKAGQPFDPGYRCWVEFFVPGAGWVPTDVVAADNASDSNPYRWVSLSATRVWLWEGRSFELSPPAHAGQIHTMICGWAEIDGQAVDPLPAADGTPSRLRRTVQFEVLKSDRAADAPRLPE